MTRDPIVEETRALRDEIAREYDYDITAIFGALRRMETESTKEHVSLPSRATEEPAAVQRGDAADRPPAVR